MSEMTREKIFHGVLKLARQGGQLHAVTVQQIATAAGLGKGTLYEYFSAKEEILAATMLWCVDRELSALEEQLEQAVSYEEQLETVQRFTVCLMRERASSYRMITAALAAPQSMGELPPPAQEALGARKDRLVRMIQRVIDTGRREGQIGQSCSDEYCRYVIKAALLSICAAQTCEGESGLDKSAAHVRAMVCKALA